MRLASADGSDIRQRPNRKPILATNSADRGRYLGTL
jgi:hypothetical protein